MFIIVEMASIIIIIMSTVMPTMKIMLAPAKFFFDASIGTLDGVRARPQLSSVLRATRG